MWYGAIANSESAYASEWAATQGKFWSSPVVDADGTIYVVPLLTLKMNRKVY
ncbi:hypothetical protein NXV02_06740 [Bacteroides ovatus]|nr:hypothetical protein [Bacteroides ovatus]